MQFQTNKLLAEVTFPADLLCFLLRKTWRLVNLDITAPACCLMLLPPEISGARCTVHGTFHHAKVRRSPLAWPITTPPVLLVKFYFIMEAMENLKQEARTHSGILVMSTYHWHGTLHGSTELQGRQSPCGCPMKKMDFTLLPRSERSIRTIIPGTK